MKNIAIIGAGMTGLSLVPEIAKYKGLNFEKLVESILLDASINK